MTRYALSLMLLALAVANAFPSEALAAALADCQRQPEALRPQLRYLDLTNLPAKDRFQAWQILSGHVNHLSTEPDIVRPALIAGSKVIRLNMADYGWKADVWERLLDDEPYFHVTIERDQEYGHYYGNRWVTTEIRKERQKAAAPWLNAQQIAALITLTQSQVPIVRADWFFSQTAVQAERKAGYYEWLGIKDQKAFERLIGFNAKVAAAAKRKELLEAVSDSGVTQEPRRIGRFEAVGPMGYWRTFDNFAGTAKDERNPLRILDDKTFNFVASEEYGALPNRLWVTGLFTKDGKRQDTVPDQIAHDKTSLSNDGRLHVNLSCTRCHGPHAGLQPIEEWARGMFREKLVLQSPDYETLKDLRQKYLRDLQGPLEEDRKVYTRALFQATGMAPPAYAKAYSEFWSRFEDERVDLARAAEEIGVKAEEFAAALESYLKATGSVDTVLAAFLRGKSIKRRQWEEVFPIAQQIVKGAGK